MNSNFKFNEEPNYLILNHSMQISQNKPSRFIVKKRNPNALIPTKCSTGAAGYDLYASEDCIISAGNKGKVKTGLSWMIPQNTYARIAPRSGLTWNHSINVGAGVIDRDYRGQIMVILFNLGKEDFIIKPADRIAQVIIEKIQPTEIEQTFCLDDTIRGQNGFGSTGESSLKKLSQKSENKQNGLNEIQNS